MVRQGNAAASTPSVQAPTLRQDLAMRSIFTSFFVLWDPKNRAFAGGNEFGQTDF